MGNGTEGRPLTVTGGWLQIAGGVAALIVLWIVASAFAPEEFGRYRTDAASTVTKADWERLADAIRTHSHPEFTPPLLPPVEPDEPPDRLEEFQSLVGTVTTVQQTLDELRELLTDPAQTEALEHVEQRLAGLEKALVAWSDELRDWLSAHNRAIKQLQGEVFTPQASPSYRNLEVPPQYWNRPNEREKANPNPSYPPSPTYGPGCQVPGTRTR